MLDASQNPEVANTTLSVGSGGPRFYLALDPADSDPNTAFLLVNAHSAEGAATLQNRINQYANLYFPAARYRVTRLAMGAGEPGLVEIKIKGEDGDALLAAAYELESAFMQLPQLGFVENDWGNKQLKIQVDIAQDQARDLGVTSKDISDVMDSFFLGETYSSFREPNADSIPIVVRAGESFRNSLEDLANLSIPANGNLIALDQVSQFRPVTEFTKIQRSNQSRQITIRGKSSTLAANKALALLQPAIDDIQTTLGPDYEIVIGGEVEQSAEVNEKLGGGLPAALLVMLTALIYQFNSARRVSLTFMTIPLILAGAPLGLLLANMPLSFFGILGLISLMGIIINNAIVLIDQIDIQRQSLPLKDAIISAAKMRFVPISLTSTTTILGLVPMALTGGPMFEPMATLMIGGLLVAAPLTLFFVPSGYYWLFIRQKDTLVSA